eukprot:CAMPEP_0197632038 /NCGR_PEP_ID=MMETSP1338-20131121/8980_1 /TAXON_ID=43686 ORGANISM="Pelagodinium beii, Strain RCC1491" /NCGR_SAMPLE_ID=MMETSP1338 /ASSEMBLY_ACC=CAM_ASM_000754 /LENGTH=480 /DNA_ID=CAMNT_0043203587 /DNA_START=64 /DNA_END=1506 /DNA_ORIENTATION=+
MAQQPVVRAKRLCCQDLRHLSTTSILAARSTYPQNTVVSGPAFLDSCAPKQPGRMTTVLFVFHADRGHFNICLPLAKKLKSSVRCELWTNTICESWILPDCFDAVHTDFGPSNINTLAGKYKAAASYGDSDADGQRHLCSNGMAVLGEILAQEGEPAPASEDGMLAFKTRLAEPDVACVVFEVNWGKWARDAALACGKPYFGLMPSYAQAFRAAYSTEPIWGFDGQEIMRTRPQDIDQFFGDWPVAQDAAYVIADCLVGKATNSAGRHRIGPFLSDIKTVEDADLREWLDGHALPEEERVVTVVSLGSQSALSTLSASAELDLLQGCLAASPRVLIASKSCAQVPELKASIEKGQLRALEFLPLWDVLNHRNVRCLVSHAGANSVHEALMSGTPAVPLPFFDDQFYIAMRLEEIYGYVGKVEPLRKAILRSGGAAARAKVEAAVRLGLAVPDSIVVSLQQAVLKEDGLGQAEKNILRKVR